MRAPFCDRWQKKVWQVRIQTEAVKCSRPRPTRPGRGGRTERESQTGVSDNAVSKTAGDRQNMAGCKSQTGGVGVDGGTERTRLHRLRRNGCAATCRCDCTKQNRTSTESFRQTGPLRLEALKQKTSVHARSFL